MVSCHVDHRTVGAVAAFQEDWEQQVPIDAGEERLEVETVLWVCSWGNKDGNVLQWIIYQRKHFIESIATIRLLKGGNGPLKCCISCGI
eukprot:4839316-Ditylum_brightwellii.AAC.1